MPFEHLNFTRKWELSSETTYKLGQCQALVDILSVMPLPISIKKELKQVAFVKGAQATTAIEGNTLTEEEIKRIFENEHLSESKAYQEQEVRNVLDAMSQIAQDTVSQQQRKPVTPELLQYFHEMIGKGLADVIFKAAPGQFAQSQRVVADYRCPPPGRRENQVEWMTKKLCQWLQAEFNSTDKKQAFKNGIIKAIVTHVYIEWIHPFDDGNGRTGRLVEFYLLLCAGAPVVCAHLLSNHYNDTRSEYYGHIRSCQRSGDLTSFIAYAITGFFDGLHTIWKTTVAEHFFRIAWQDHVHYTLSHLKLSNPTFKRRKKLLLGMLPEKNYDLESIQRTSPEIARTYAKMNISTLKRDIQNLISHDLLTEDSQSKKLHMNIRYLYPEKLWRP